MKKKKDKPRRPIATNIQRIVDLEEQVAELEMRIKKLERHNTDE